MSIRLLLPLAVWAALSFYSQEAKGVAYTVNSLADAGAGAGTNGDLRYCINQANALAGPHTISFTGQAGTITLGSTLPVITRQISILGNTGLGYTVATPVIQINATAAGWGFLFNNAGGANSVIRGLVINRAQFTNIELNNCGNITIQDCFIGVNLAGNASAGTNPNFGIQLVTSSNNQILNNVVSGHATHGILVNVNSLNNIIRGNKVGTNALGTAAIPNAFHGIEINNTSTGTIIGGNAAGERNLISGNTHIGVSIIGGSTGTQVIANYIGVDAAGTAAIANGEHGVFSNASGAVTITNNVISGNTIFGVLLMGANTHVIRGNKIGTNAAGTAAVANLNAGISIQSGNFVTIGGTGAGEGNVLSGNGDVGLRFESSTNATVQGNFIGTNGTGTAAIPNANMGIYATTGCNTHTIGGNTAAARNIISGNNIHGIMYTNNCNDLTIQGNYIGTNAAGGGAGATFGNGQIGILISNGCLRPIIGGTTAAQMNVISGNGRLWVSGVNNGTGIQFENGIQNGFIRGNYVGIAVDGTTAMPNRENGIVILGGCDNLTLGGNTAATRNVISSNGFQAVVINGASAALIIGNYIGVDASGTLARGNGQSGVILIFSNNSIIGRANAGEGNILSNNGELGIHVVGGNGNTIYNNYIGVAANGTTAMGNRNGGIFIQGVGGGANGSSTTVGGTAALQPNIIAYSTNTGANPNLGNGFGIGVAHNDQGIQNRFIANKIFCNAGLGIDLNFAGAFGGPGVSGIGNGGKTAPVITAVTATSTSGTGTNGETIHVYSNVTCTDCEGEIYLGTVNVTGGTWSLTHVAVANPANNSATATNNTLGTSQFSCNTALPVTWLNFTAELKNTTVQLEWSTGSEINNEHFEVERSSDGIHFYSIGTVAGKGNYSGLSKYSFTDSYPLAGISYYRIRQVDFDGSFEYSVIRTIQAYGSGVVLYPNPTEGEVYLIMEAAAVDGCEITLRNVLGEVLSVTTVAKGSDQLSYKLDLSGFENGVYIVSVRYAQEIKSYSLIKQ